MNQKNETAPRSELLRPSTRRDFVSKARYAAPALLSLPAIPAFAQVGSAMAGGGGDQDYDPQYCLSQWDQFIADNSDYSSLQDLYDAIAAQEGGQATQEQRDLFYSLSDAFQGTQGCEIS